MTNYSIADELSLAKWAATPGGREFMDQRPDADLAAELAEHNAERVAGRGRNQPRFEDQAVDVTVAERWRASEPTSDSPRRCSRPRNGGIGTGDSSRSSNRAIVRCTRSWSSDSSAFGSGATRSYLRIRVGTVRRLSKERRSP